MKRASEQQMKGILLRLHTTRAQCSIDVQPRPAIRFPLFPWTRQGCKNGTLGAG